MVGVVPAGEFWSVAQPVHRETIAAINSRVLKRVMA